MSKKIFEVLVSSPDIEERSWELFSLGVGGVETVSSDAIRFFHESDESSLAVLLSEITNCGFKVEKYSEIKRENWVAKFEELLTPFTVNKLLVTPVKDCGDGQKISRKSSEVVLIPGMGFGTGHHPTTRMLLELMQEESVIQSPPKFAIDVGTGSGILSLGLSKVYPSCKILAFDNDPIAIDNAKENCDLNTPHNITIEVSELNDSYSPKPDVIIANIYAEVLIKLEPEFKKVIAPNGVVLLSGITQEAAPGLREHYTSNGWSVIKEEIRGEWYSVAVKIA